MISCDNVRNNTRCPCAGWQSYLVLTTKHLLVEALFSFLKVAVQVQSSVQTITFWYEIWVHRFLFQNHKCHWPSFRSLTNEYTKYMDATRNKPPFFPEILEPPADF